MLNKKLNKKINKISRIYQRSEVTGLNNATKFGETDIIQNVTKAETLEQNAVPEEENLNCS